MRVFAQLGFATLVLLAVVPGSAGHTDSLASRELGTQTLAVREFPVSASAIAPGPDGNLWFSGGASEYVYADRIGWITSARRVREFPASADEFATSIAAGPDGNLWFTQGNNNWRIGQITKTGKITEFNVPYSGSQPDQITAGPDGNLWFTESPGGGIPVNTAKYKIARITPAGKVTQFPLPNAGVFACAIVTGADGNLWFTESDGAVGRITPAGKAVTMDLIPYRADQIAAGPDGKIWFTDWANHALGRITPGGKITEFTIPDNVGNPVAITAGPDGNIWFTEGDGDIGRSTPTGSIKLYEVKMSSAPMSITAGPNHSLWLELVHAIGEIKLA